MLCEFYLSKKKKLPKKGGKAENSLLLQSEKKMRLKEKPERFEAYVLTSPLLV